MGQEPEKTTTDEQSTVSEAWKGVSTNLAEYWTRVRKVQNLNEWMELNQQLLDTPFAGIDQFATGTVFGMCSGIACRKALQFTALLAGFGFISLQFMHYYGYLSVDWTKVQKRLENQLDLNKDGKVDRLDFDIAKRNLLRVFTWGLPSAGGFSTGFLIGLKTRF